ncbi:MAG: serine hydroxymethyltransferase [Rhodobacteraceae bacterium]|nr:serine hydroxymethyltransferase [Paracoccaceae bacterium]
MGQDDPVAGEVYLEFQRFGNQVRVTAMDAQTGVEVYVIGPLNAAQHDLQSLAVRKLKRRLEQEKPEPLFTGRGRIV